MNVAMHRGVSGLIAGHDELVEIGILRSGYLLGRSLENDQFLAISMSACRLFDDTMALLMQCLDGKSPLVGVAVNGRNEKSAGGNKY